jgi:hypothetical protein
MRRALERINLKQLILTSITIYHLSSSVGQKDKELLQTGLFLVSIHDDQLATAGISIPVVAKNDARYDDTIRWCKRDVLQENAIQCRCS